MRIRHSLIILATIFVLVFVSSSAIADTLKLKDGTKVEGIITKIEAGKVYVSINEKLSALDLDAVEAMDFETSLVLADPKLPLEHFLTNTEAQGMVRNIEQLDRSIEEIRKLMSQIQLYWAAKEPIDVSEERVWAAAKETFRQPLLAYQEVLSDLYFHVLARLDQYNLLMKDASKIYVGIKGVRIGSALIPPEMEELPLKRYVASAWYDTIFDQGYNAGYADATARLAARPNFQ